MREYDKFARWCANDGVDHVRNLMRLGELELIDREHLDVCLQVGLGRGELLPGLGQRVGIVCLDGEGFWPAMEKAVHFD